MEIANFIYPLSSAANFASEVGGKALELSKLIEKGFPIPDGVVVSVRIFDYIDNSLLHRMEEKINQVNLNDPSTLESVCAEVRDTIYKLDPPGFNSAIKNIIEANFDKDTGFAVRSSCIGEDGTTNSFAGEHDTYLWVCGIENIIDAVKRCWASMFNTRAVIYRRQRSLPIQPMAVLIQQMINARSSGVMMTLNPQDGDQSVIAIESAWGLGELIVSGGASPDLYLLNKINGKLLSSSVAAKTIMMQRAPGGGVHEVPVSEENINIAVLMNTQLEELYQLAKLTIKTVEYRNVDIEFAFDNKLWVLQVRPETYWSNIKKSSNNCTSAMKLILQTWDTSGGINE